MTISSNLVFLTLLNWSDQAKFNPGTQYLFYELINQIKFNHVTGS